MGSRLIEKCITFIFDILSFAIAFTLTFWLRFKSNIFPGTYNPDIDFYTYITPLIILSIVWFFLFFFTGLYRDWYKESRFDEFLVVSRTVLIGIFLFFLIISADEIIKFATSGVPPTLFTQTQFATLLTYGICMLSLATLNRFTLHSFFSYLFSRGIGIRNVLIIGTKKDGQRLIKEINNNPQLGYKVAGFIDDNGKITGNTIENYRVLGTYSDLPSLIDKYNISGIIISHVSISSNEIIKIINYCLDKPVTIYMVPTLLTVISSHFKSHQIHGIPLVVLLKEHMPSWESQIKRLLDIFISTTVLLLFFPVWLLIGMIIRTTSPGPVIFKQKRVGMNGKIFTMYKFRSMYKDAESKTGAVWASENDPRVTPFGRLLRKTRIDEIPQLFNVLKGEMSLVGPRPERPEIIKELQKEIPWYIRRIKMRPGITGWGQIKHKYDESIDDVKQKVLYDLYYFENMSVILDLKIIIRTILVIFTGRGAR